MPVYTPVPDSYLSSLLNEFYEKHNVPYSTKLIYERATKSLFTVTGDKPIYEYTKADIEDFINGLDLSIQTKGIYARHLKVIFNFFKERDYIEANPVPKLKLPKNEVVAIPSDHV